MKQEIKTYSYFLDEDNTLTLFVHDFDNRTYSVATISDVIEDNVEDLCEEILEELEYKIKESKENEED